MPFCVFIMSDREEIDSHAFSIYVCEIDEFSRFFPPVSRDDEIVFVICVAIDVLCGTLIVC